MRVRPLSPSMDTPLLVALELALSSAAFGSLSFAVAEAGSQLLPLASTCVVGWDGFWSLRRSSLRTFSRCCKFLGGGNKWHNSKSLSRGMKSQVSKRLAAQCDSFHQDRHALQWKSGIETNKRPHGDSSNRITASQRGKQT